MDNCDELLIDKDRSLVEILKKASPDELALIANVLISFRTDILTIELIQSLTQKTENQLGMVKAIEQVILKYGSHLKLACSNASACYKELVDFQIKKISREKNAPLHSIFEIEAAICRQVNVTIDEITYRCKTNQSQLLGKSKDIIGLATSSIRDNPVTAAAAVAGGILFGGAAVAVGLGALTLKRGIFNSDDKSLEEMLQFLIPTIHFVRNNQLDSELSYFTQNLERNI